MGADPTLTIGELANRGGVPDSTVRYYERQGLLAPEARTESNYRLYGEAAVHRLRFIRAAQASGLALRDIRTLLEFRDGTVAPCAEVKEILDSRLERVKQQLRDLQAVERTLEELHEACEAPHDDGCPAIQKLDGNPGAK